MLCRVIITVRLCKTQRLSNFSVIAKPVRTPAVAIRNLRKGSGLPRRLRLLAMTR